MTGKPWKTHLGLHPPYLPVLGPYPLVWQPDLTSWEPQQALEEVTNIQPWLDFQKDPEKVRYCGEIWGIWLDSDDFWCGTCLFGHDTPKAKMLGGDTSLTASCRSCGSRLRQKHRSLLPNGSRISKPLKVRFETQHDSLIWHWHVGFFGIGFPASPRTFPAIPVRSHPIESLAPWPFRSLLRLWRACSPPSLLLSTSFASREIRENQGPRPDSIPTEKNCSNYSFLKCSWTAAKLSWAHVKHISYIQDSTHCWSVW